MRIASEFGNDRFEIASKPLFLMDTWELVDLETGHALSSWTSEEMAAQADPHLWLATHCERAIRLYMGRYLE